MGFYDFMKTENQIPKPSNTNNTPRTDHEELSHGIYKLYHSEKDMVVPADFARTLERELNEANREKLDYVTGAESRVVQVCTERDSLRALAKELAEALVYEQDSGEIGTDMAMQSITKARAAKLIE